LFLKYLKTLKILMNLRKQIYLPLRLYQLYLNYLKYQKLLIGLMIHLNHLNLKYQLNLMKLKIHFGQINHLYQMNLKRHLKLMNRFDLKDLKFPKNLMNHLNLKCQTKLRLCQKNHLHLKNQMNHLSLKNHLYLKRLKNHLKLMNHFYLKFQKHQMNQMNH
jgi:hypothetical protein